MKYIGDVVLTTPLLRSLRRALPGAHIAYLADRHAASLLAGNPFLDEIIPYDFSLPAIREQVRVAVLLRRRRFDLVLDLFSNPRSALLSWLSGATVRVGLDRRGRRQLYTLRVRDDGRPKAAVELINQFTADPECDLDYIPNEAREQQVEIGVSNGFGFGGHNACVVFRRWDESA